MTRLGFDVAAVAFGQEPGLVRARSPGAFDATHAFAHGISRSAGVALRPSGALAGDDHLGFDLL
jgi:hypothetical protein